MNTSKTRGANFTGQHTATNELLLKIHTATGWRLPKTEHLCFILCRQLENKLRFDYPMVTYDQAETAFLQFGTEENFTGTMSIAQIDKVLRKYFASITDENFNQERKHYEQVIPIPQPHQHLDECRELIECKYQLYLSDKLNIELLPPFIFEVLVRDYGIDPELPMRFIQEAKEFIAERKGKGRIGKTTAISEILIEAGPQTLEYTCLKLAIEHSFEIFKNRNQEHLYQFEE